MIINIPEHIKASIDRYVSDKVPTGQFLRAVLSNDLFDALGRADEFSRDALPEICSYIYNEVPGSCWGSPEKVKEWLES